MQENLKKPWHFIISHPIQTMFNWGNDIKWLWIVIISIITGWDLFIVQSQIFNLGEKLSLFIILILLFFLGPIIGAITLFLGSAISFGIGKIFRGKATYQQILNVTIVSAIPYIFLIPLWMIYIILYKSDYFTQERIFSYNFPFVLLYQILNYTEFSIICWALIIFVIGFCKVNQFNQLRFLFYPITGLLILILFISVSFNIIYYFVSNMSSPLENDVYKAILDEDYDEAMKLLDEILAEDPDNDIGLYYKGYIYLEFEEYEKAANYLEQSVAVKPNEFIEYFNLGFAYFEIDEVEKSIDAYQKAIDLGVNRDEVVVYHNLGYAYYDLENYKEAIPYFEKYISYEPYDVETLWYLVFAYEEEENITTALEYLEDIIYYDSTTIDGYLYKADMLAYYEYYPEALKAYEKVIVEFPNDAAGHYGKAQILSVYNQPQKAVASLRKSFAIDAEYTEDVIYDPMFDHIRSSAAFTNFLKTCYPITE